MKTKKAFLLILMSALGLLNAYSQLPSYVPSNGLVGYWPFNGNANDESGNGNNGIVNGATLTADRNGVANKAYSFDGLTNYLFIQNTLLPSLQNNLGMSISLWFRTNDTGASFISDRYNGSNYFKYFVGISNGQIVHSNLSSNCNNPCLTNFTSDVWNHLVVIKNSNTNSIYLNGTLVFTSSNVCYNSANNPTQIGRWGGNNDAYYLGILDDIAFYNRALTQQEITTLYTSCSNPIATITPQSSTTFCQGGSVNLNASTGVNYAYQWYNNGNIINNATSSVYNATTSGDYTLKVTDGACNATSSAQTVTVNTNPSVSLNALNNVVFKTSLPITLVGNPTGGTYSGDAVSGSTFTPANATLGKKIISYNYTTQQGCSGSASQETIVTDSVGNVCGTYDTLRIKVKFTVGLYANTINTIKFYPNPTKDILFIDNGNYQAMNGYSIKIVSLAGTVIYNQPITSQQVQISMNQFATKGLYIAQIVDSNNAIVDSKKIVLE